MKKISQIMEELGFNKEAPTSTKEAFIKHLLAHSGVQVMTPSEKQILLDNPEKIKVLQKAEQLAFTFIEEEFPKPKKPIAAS